MKSETPILVSAIVSTCNSARFLEGCLTDLECQTISDRIEIIVIDSGSEQRERDIVREFQNRYRNISYLRTEARETVYAAWNRGIRMAHGRYITSANTDDRHRRDAFERMAAALEARPEVALVYADVLKTATENETFERCTPTGAYRWYDWDRNLLLTKGCFIGPQPMWRRRVHDLYGFFDPALVSSGDYEFWLRISQSMEFHHLGLSLGLYLERPDSIEHRCRKIKMAEDAVILARYLTAAKRAEIIGCEPLDRLRRLSADRGDDGPEPARLISWIEEVISSMGPGSAPYQDRGRKNLAEFRILKQAIVSGHPSGEILERFRKSSSEMILMRSRWFPAFSNNLDGRSSVRQPNLGGPAMMSYPQMYDAFQPLMDKSRPEENVEVLQCVIRSFPEFARAYNDLGVQLYRAGDTRAARENYEKAVQLEPGNIAFLKNLADFHFVEEQRVEDALRLYVRVLGIEPRDVETLTVTGHICVSLRNFEDAKLFYARVLEIEPWNAEVRANLEKVEQITSGAAPAAGRPPRELHAEALTLAAGGNSAEAMGALERLLRADPHFALAHNDLGVLCFNSGDESRALSHYEQAVRLEPDNLTFKKNLADFHFVARQRIEDALRLYVEVLEKDPQDMEALTAMAKICASLERTEDAELFFQRVLEIEPWNAEAGRGLERLRRGRTAPPPAQSAETQHAEAGRLAGGGDVEGALAALRRLVDAFPDFALGHNDLGVLCCRTGDFEAALKHYERAVALAPGETTFKKNLADLYWVKLGRVKEAMDAYVDILSVDPEDVETLLATGRVCVALKQFDDARVFFDRVLEIEPWNSAAHQLLGELQGLSRAA